jgi:hypothetical protein
MERVTVATGRYLAHEAGRLAGVPGDRIGQWARWGHIRASVSAGDPHVYAFADVAEALAVHLLLDAGFTLPVVRRAVERLGGLTGGLHVVDHRLAVERGDVLQDVFTEQTVLPGLAALVAASSGFAGLDSDGRLDAVGLLCRGGWVARERDLGVEVDPSRCGGRPCVRGRRVPVEDAVEDPDGLGITADELAGARAWLEAAESVVRG